MDRNTHAEERACKMSCWSTAFLAAFVLHHSNSCATTSLAQTFRLSLTHPVRFKKLSQKAQRANSAPNSQKQRSKQPSKQGAGKCFVSTRRTQW